MPIVADAAVKIGADFSTFGRELDQGTTRPIQNLGQRIRGALSPQNLAIGGAILGGAVIAGLADATRALIDIERLNAQTEAVIRSTGGAANVTREQIEAAAEAAESATTIEREAVQEAENLLLTFTNIRNEAGAGNDIFNQTTDAVLDMSVAMGTDARTSAMQLGKALNDPVRGMANLARSGVQFTEQQKAMVAALVESGDLLGAQRVILRELETQFGGSAEAFANTTAGKIQRFQNDVGNMFESIILGAVNVADFFGSTAASVGEGLAGIGDAFGAAGDFIGSAFDGPVEEAGQRLETLPPTAYAAAFAGMEEFGRGVAAGGPVVAEEAGKVAGMLPAEIRARDAEIRAAGRENVIQFALGVLDAQNDPKVAFEVLTRLQDEEMTRAEEIAYLHGLATSAELAAGQVDGRPGVSLAALQLRREIDERLGQLGADAFDWGYDIGRELQRGLDYSLPIVRTAAGGLANAVRGQIGIRSEPEAADSPLRGITKWGGNIVKSIAEGMLGELGTGRSAAGALAGVLMPAMGMPTMGAVAASGSAGGITYQLVVNGVPRSFKSRDDFMNALDDLGSFGDGRL